jgi:hypothetical protein
MNKAAKKPDLSLIAACFKTSQLPLSFLLLRKSAQTANPELASLNYLRVNQQLAAQFVIVAND